MYEIPAAAAAGQIQPAEDHHYEAMNVMNPAERNQPKAATSRSRWIIAMIVLCLFIAGAALIIGITPLIITRSTHHMDSDKEGSVNMVKTVEDRIINLEAAEKIYEDRMLRLEAAEKLYVERIQHLEDKIQNMTLASNTVTLERLTHFEKVTESTFAGIETKADASATRITAIANKIQNMTDTLASNTVTLERLTHFEKVTESTLAGIHTKADASATRITAIANKIQNMTDTLASYTVTADRLTNFDKLTQTTLASMGNNADASAARITEIANKIQNMTDTLASYTVTADRLTNFDKLTQTTLASMGNKVDASAVRITEIANKIQNMTDTLASYTVTAERLTQFEKLTQTTLADIENQADASATRITEIAKQAAGGSVAFTAVMNEGLFHPQPGQVIPFTSVQLNAGHHYDPSTSRFTCPVRGLYLFSVSLYSNGIGGPQDKIAVDGALMLDGEKMAEVYSRNSDPDHYQRHQAATTVVLDCPAGGSVWVVCRWSDVRMFGSDSAPYTVFTGFIIKSL